MRKLLIIQIVLIGLVAHAQNAYVPPVPSDGNFIFERSYQVEKNSHDELSLESDVIESIQYFDGLGRGQQTIGIGQSPTGADMVTPYEYDMYGRQLRDWLSFPSNQYARGAYKPGSRLDAQQFYSSHYAQDFQGLPSVHVNAYSEKRVEASPIGRPLKQAAPGKDWKMTGADDNDHTIGFGYQSNTHDPSQLTDSTNDNVRLFTVSISAADNEKTSLSSGAYYDAGELSKSITKDENHNVGQKNHTIEEFTNNYGKVILKRTFADVPATGNSQAQPEVPHDTYYVYDDFGNLSYVLPPKMNPGTASLAELNSQLSALAYMYVYDFRNRLVEKKIPGKGLEYIIYNNIDLPILTQDAEQRKRAEWLFTKYDVHSRVAYTGKATINMDRSSLQDVVTALPDNYSLWTERTSGNQTQTIAGTAMYYTPGAYPQSNITEILTINYYDDYIPKPVNAPESITLLGSQTNETQTDQVKGLPTVNQIKILDSDDDWITRMNYYDEKARPVYSYIENSFLGTTDIIEAQLDFVGKPLKTKTTHIRAENTIVTIDNFTYDHVGRLLSQIQCIGAEDMNDFCDVDHLVLTGTIDNLNVANETIEVPHGELIDGGHLDIDQGGPELIVFNSYDELGQLKAKKVGGQPADDYNDTQGLQTINYAYNIRGWLKHINEDVDNDNDLFNYTLRYNNPLTGDALYNGTVSQSSWHTLNEDSSMKTYSYSYDPLNRIVSAIGTGSLSKYDLNDVSYDKNGNIMTLRRKGHTGLNNNGDATSYGLMDDLSYSYAGNKLTKVIDTGNTDYGFKDGTNSNRDFAYDSNGNLELDRNKGITAINYNHLNLPGTISLGANGDINYVYDATGNKLKKVTTGSSPMSTEYAGNYIYEDGKLQFSSTAEGYVMPKNPDNLGLGFNYVYHYKDHVGNVRLSFTNHNDTLKIVDENNYYPFGLQHKGYNAKVNVVENNYQTFNGQEHDENFDLNNIEMTYRQYDPAIARFNVIDPAAELAGNWTPYRFGFNNPISYNDPLGLWEINSDGSWFTDDTKDIERFLGMLQIENDFGGGADISQIDKFISEEFHGTGGRLSNGSLFLDGVTVAIDKKGRSKGFSARQADHISQQVEKYGSNPWNAGTGESQHWAYSYKYFRERSWHQNGGSFPGLKLGGKASRYASKFISNSKGWYSLSQGKRYGHDFHGNQYTEKRINVKNFSSWLDAGGKVIGVYGLYGTYGEWSEGKLSNAGAAYLGGADAAGLTKNPHAGAWSLGTGIGKVIVETDWYFNTFQNRSNW